MNLDQLQRAHFLRESGQALQAEFLYLEVLKTSPASIDALSQLAELAMARGDVARATGFLETAVRYEPSNCRCALNLAVAYLGANDHAKARERLESTLRLVPSFFVGWLLLGQVLEEHGRPADALKAYFEAVKRARAEGRWLDEESTPPGLLSSVLHAIDRLRTGKRTILEASFSDVRELHGSRALVRVDRALSGYLRDWDATPTDERQRPKFFYFPDLPDTPYHDPYLQPWARQLQAAFPAIRADAVRVLEEDRRLPNFIPDGARVEDFVSGQGPAPSWEAFFFYRHGQRYDANHQRCPETSAVLESMELCRITDQAPEILFSVLKPGSHINAHHGVTNVRLVMHLPLVVPPDCALNLVDRGEHQWQESQLVMFDDTFLHEAWNRSDQTRIVLLMDCWNPHLTAVEKLATRQLIETITALQRCDRGPSPTHEPD